MRSADTRKLHALMASAALGFTMVRSSPPSALPTTSENWTEIPDSASASPYFSSGRSSGMAAARAASNGGVASPARNASTSTAPTGISMSMRAKSAARGEVGRQHHPHSPEAVGEGRQHLADPHEAGQGDGGDRRRPRRGPVRSNTSTVRASRPAQSPSSEMTSAVHSRRNSGIDSGERMAADAKLVWETELGNRSFESLPVKWYSTQDFLAPFASGSGQFNTMIIAPCSMGTLARIATRYFF